MIFTLSPHKKALSLLVLFLLFALASTASAAGLDTNVLSGSGGDTFNKNMKQFLDSMLYVGKIISTIMVCLGGIMVATNMDSGNKLLWNAILGIGIVLNITTGLLMPAFDQYIPKTGTASNPSGFKFELITNGEVNWSNFFNGPSGFLQKLHEYTKYGATQMVVPAAKLLLIFTAINATIKISLDLITGDKVRYLATLLLETGAYLFLITNWYTPGSMDIMESLMSGFEQLGYQAGGIDDNPNNDILGAGCKMFLGATKNFDFDMFSPISSLAQIVCLGAMLILLVLTGLEMYMARIEFWIMAMLTIPLIPFAALPQTRSFFEKALGCMINLAIKCCVIAFIAAMSTGILESYVNFFAPKEKEYNGLSGIFEHISDSINKDVVSFPVLIQALLVSLVLFLLVKNIPKLVQGLLSGNPQLQGSNMREMAGTAAKGAAAVATGGAAVAKAAAAGGISSGFKAAGAAKAGGAGGLRQAASGVAHGIGGALNAGAGAMAQGGLGLAKNALLGSAGGGGAGGSGGSGRNGGLLQPFREGSRMGNMFSTTPKKGEERQGLTDMVKNGASSALDRITGGAQKEDVIKRDPNNPNQPMYDDYGKMQTTKAPTGKFLGPVGAFKEMKQTASESFQAGKNSKKDK